MNTRLERFRYQGNTYFYYVDNPKIYWYEDDDSMHVIIYECKDYGGVAHKAEWRIPGSKDKGILYAKRLSSRISPWDVINQGPSPYLAGDGMDEQKRAV